LLEEGDDLPLKTIKTDVNYKLIELHNEFTENPFSVYRVKVQDGVPVNAKKIRDIEKPKKA